MSSGFRLPAPRLLHQAHPVEARRDIGGATRVSKGNRAAGAGDVLRDNHPICRRETGGAFEQIILVQDRRKTDLHIVAGDDRRRDVEATGRVGGVGAGEVLLQVAETIAVVVASGIG
jgi:hypothetical protein